MTYSKFVHGLKAAGLDLNRKVLADVALHDDGAFRNLAELAKSALAVKASAQAALEKE
jgi:large subunit ribosomal protein L20